MRELKELRLSPLSLLQVCAVLLVVAFACFSVTGQTTSGRISGTVVDSSGAVVPNATVTVTNSANNAARTAETDESGFFTVTNLPVGTYSISVERTGFKKANQTDNVLATDQRLTVNITLEAGSVSETVEVSTAAGETVNTTSGELARVVDKRQVQNLARLHASFLRTALLTRTDKLRFLRCYLQWGLFGRTGWKRWWRDIDQATSAKVARNAGRGRPLS
jgi:hypothetical protein